MPQASNKWIPKLCDWTFNVRTGETTLVKTVPDDAAQPAEQK